MGTKCSLCDLVVTGPYDRLGRCHYCTIEPVHHSVESKAAAPDRPLDTWRICGQWMYDMPGRGCTCQTANPSDERIAEACARLGMDAPPPRKRSRRR